MLENCLSGSEGGGAIALPTPIIAVRRGRGYGWHQNKTLKVSSVPSVSSGRCSPSPLDE